MKYGLSSETYIKIKQITEKYSKYTFKIFGSRARGNYKINSDIDIAVENCIDEKDKFNIKNDFDKLDIPYMVDLVFIEDIKKKEFLKSVIQEAIKYE